MISVTEALAIIASRVSSRPAVEFDVQDTAGLTLTEDIASDIDSPPWDKSIVDGYAVRTAELVDGAATLDVIEEIAAGQVPTRSLAAGQATRIMTGAPIPAGADGVVMVEFTECESRAGLHDRVSIREARVRPGGNILPRAAALRRGQLVLPTGTVLGPAQIALLCEVGRPRVRVISPVRAAVLATGNELVDPSQQPGPGQIRNSNGPMLAQQLRAMGALVQNLGVARDDRDALRTAIARAKAGDLLVLSGGVSAGVLDLVPGVLAELGVVQQFHKVRIKPGKPLWFGIWPQTAGACYVFGLPGNPVSSFVCCQLFVRAALERLQGRPEVQPATLLAVLANSFTQRGERPTYHPAKLDFGTHGARVEALRWQGSADLLGLAQANALAVFPEGDRLFAAGETISVLPL